MLYHLITSQYFLFNNIIPVVAEKNCFKIHWGGSEGFNLQTNFERSSAWPSPQNWPKIPLDQWKWESLLPPQWILKHFFSGTTCLYICRILLDHRGDICQYRHCRRQCKFCCHRSIFLQKQCDLQYKSKYKVHFILISSLKLLTYYQLAQLY